MRGWVIWFTAVAFILGFALGPTRVRCLVEDTEPETMRVAMLHYGPIGDSGWTYLGHVAAQQLAQSIPWIAVEEVEDAPARGGAQLVREYADAGFDLVFTHGWGSDLVPGIASDYADVVLMCGGAHGRLGPNVGTYYGRTHEARFLAGMIAGRMTEAGSIGYAPSYPLPRVIAGINAFARGVAATNPDATVRIEWVGEWYDPAREGEAIATLIERGCDVVTHDTDSFACAQAAEEGGAFYIASHGQGTWAFAPSVYLTGIEWDWTPLFADVVTAVRDGTWGARADAGWWYGLAEGCVTLASMSDLVPEAVRQEVEARRDEILRGEFVVFPELTEEELWQIDTFEPNVVSGLAEG
jgi:basic membrane protein A